MVLIRSLLHIGLLEWLIFPAILGLVLCSHWEEEERLYKYAVEMTDCGFRLTRDDFMRLAFVIVEKSGRPNPFHDRMAGCGWMDGFRQRHPKIALHTPQSLSYSRAVMVSQYTVDDFFGKLGGLCGRLNMISKPMQIYNADETGISVVHKPGKVISELGRKYVYCVTSGKKGRTRTIMCCVSASGVALPPLIVYPQKKKSTWKHKEKCCSRCYF